MSHWIGTTTPADAGMVEFKECLRRLRDGAATDALMHARRALGVAPKNPFYLSYTGLLAAVAERRFGDAETLCREAIGVKCNHAQLYLNLAEVYHQAGRTSEAIETLDRAPGRRARRLRTRLTAERAVLSGPRGDSMIMGRSGQIRPKTTHDHETAPARGCRSALGMLHPSAGRAKRV